MVGKKMGKLNGKMKMRTDNGLEWNATTGKIPGMNIETEGKKLSNVYGMKKKVDLSRY